MLTLKSLCKAFWASISTAFSYFKDIDGVVVSMWESPSNPHIETVTFKKIVIRGRVIIADPSLLWLLS